MSQQLNPYISFAGDCADAMEFYGRVLGGTPRLNTFREAGMDADGVMHASLDTDAGFHLFGCDAVEGMPARIEGNNVQVSIFGDDADALRGYWEGLREDAQVTVPLQRQAWGDDYGQLTDRYGVVWHVNITGQE